MSQVADINVNNGTGIEVRQGFNAVIGAIATDFSGPTAPANPFPGMMWRDNSTLPSVLKIRDDANTSWVDALSAFGGTTVGIALFKAATVVAQREALGLGSAATATLTNDDDLSVSPGNIPTRGNVAAAIDAIPAPTQPTSNITAQNFTADSYGAAIVSSGEAYARCYYGGSVHAANPGAAEFMIQASNDGGSTWGTLVSLDRTTNGGTITVGDVFLVNLSTGVCYGHKGMDLGVTNIDAIRFRINYDNATGNSDVDVALEFFD